MIFGWGEAFWTSPHELMLLPDWFVVVSWLCIGYVTFMVGVVNFRAHLRRERRKRAVIRRARHWFLPWRGWRADGLPLVGIAGLVVGMYLVLETDWPAVGVVAVVGALLTFAVLDRTEPD